MSRTESTMLELGTLAPDFILPEPLTGKTIRLSDFKGNKALLVIFMCNHCPYVLHLHKQLNDLIAEYQPKGIAAVAINANDVDSYPDDSPDKMVTLSREMNYCFPYLFDEEQSVAKTYKAACTPDFFLFDSNFKLIYRGQFDDSRPGNNTIITGLDMRSAFDAVLAAHTIPEVIQKPSMGCNIKWKVSNAPDYFA